MLATLFGRRENALALLRDHGAKPHLHAADGSTPLMCAARCGNLEVLDLILKRVNEAPAVVNARAPFGVTALHEAITCGSARCCARLVAAGADCLLHYPEDAHDDVSSPENPENTHNAQYPCCARLRERGSRVGSWLRLLPLY